MLVEVIQNDLRYLAALELDDQTHTVLVGLVANIRDAFDLLFVDELGDAFLQGLFIDLIRQGIHHDGLTVVTDVFEVCFGPHDHATAPCAITLAHAHDAVNDAASWEVWRGD